MSYDLMVFDPSAPPADREGFLAWYQEQTKWQEEHSYNDPEVTTPALRSWFLEMIEEYPPMNGPHAVSKEEVDNPNDTDYSIGRSVIYAAFGWPVAEAALVRVYELAKKHGVGFYNASSDDDQVWAPDAKGEYVLLHGATGPPPSGGSDRRKWWEFWK